MNDIYQKYEEALREIDRLRQENRQLKLQIGELIEEDVPEAPSIQLSGTDNTITQYSTVEKKLALYRNYFRGREDVYPIPSSQARRMGTIILSLTMNRRYQIGLDSYDRLFPNQDTLPKGGFGNLIALPLQGGPRRQGNSVFIDENFSPYEDQWRFLSEQSKMSDDEVSRFIQLHAAEDRLGMMDVDAESDNVKEPWASSLPAVNVSIKDSLPSELNIVMADRVYVDKSELPISAINRLMRLAFFYKTQAMRLSTYGKPRVISCAKDLPHYIALPRGCLSAVQDLFEQHGTEVVVEDKRFPGHAIDVRFDGELTMLQDAAAKAILAHDIGILSAATGFGKTVVASNIIARRKVNTLILVHRRELMDQWKERLQAFLSLPKDAIRSIGGGKNKRTNIVDIAVIQSLNRKGEVMPIVEEYGQVIVDECHHLSAYSFEQVLMKAKARYVFGLTATPKRQDGQEAIVMMQLGPIRIKVDAKMLTGSRGFSLSVVPRYTDFRMPSNALNPSIQEVYQSLVDDETRNTLIFDDLLHCLDEGRSPLLLVERRAHAEYFEERLRSFAKNVIVLRGGMGKKQRDDVREKIASIPEDEERVFIATGKLIGEGFDDSRLDTLFLVHPISWSGTLQQYAGRLHRSHANKKEVKIYDYVDLQVPVLVGMYKKRIKGYRKMGYKGAEL
ncbi:DEAD/DEAH box helicase family protein [Paenibacillaceae bacterium WGS1546]|uniref:TOTE conflict system archaeo-eukaryotic primase domain-containing protein n=1 Tax=Cohnella sp. WGS1546 TaxID=3366810 RepID=UPI00372D2E04